MPILSFLLGERKKTADAVEGHLQIILTHERTASSASAGYLSALQRELVTVISKCVKIGNDDIRINLECQDSLEVLEVKIEIPQA